MEESGWGTLSRVFWEHRGKHLISCIFILNPARRDVTGGADLGARPPAAGSLHRAGCEDGRVGQRQDWSTLIGPGKSR
jgi:hypothetical protein